MRTPRLLLSAAGLLLAVVLLSAAQRPAAADPPDLRGFQAVTPTAGWVLLDSHLYWTDDLGAHWAEITPPAALQAGGLRAGWFADPARGWLLALGGVPGADPSYHLLRTTDGGHTWQAAPLSLFAPGEPAALAGAVFLRFDADGTGWLVVEQATGSAFEVRTVFRSADDGHTWARQAGAAWPAGLAGAAEHSWATPLAGWARAATGTCQGGACALAVSLQHTADGGQTWAPLPLPGGEPALVRALAPAAEASAEVSLGGYALGFTGHGFDGCFVDSGPTPLANMQAWWNGSPYRARNLYMGGSGGAPCTPLTRAYVQQLAQQGWLFIPTWVGPQAACYAGAKTKMSGDLTLAYQQGRIEAHLALDRAAALGLARPDGSGTVLYYDLENYPNNAGCRAAAGAFISGWTEVVRAAGSLAGVYGSPCSSYLPDLAGLAHVPDAVWLAYWIANSSYDPSVSVFGVPCISDTLWSQGQRLRQYTGGHNETWNGVTLNIDSNVLAGPVSTVAGDCQPGAGQVALFGYPNFGGQCVVRSTGVYSTVESLGLPNDSLSSVRLGLGAQVRLCQHHELGGVCTLLTADAADLGAYPIGDNAVSSYQVQPAAPGPRYYFPLIATGPAVVHGLPNGGFEAGPVTWGLSSTNSRALIVPAGTLTLTGGTAHGGGWAAWLGGALSETAALAQTLPIPPDAPYLAYWQWVDSAESGCHYDIVSVWVNDAVVDAYGLCAALETNSWTRRTVDLRAFAGQTVSVRLQFSNDSSDLSSLFLDDVAFESKP